MCRSENVLLICFPHGQFNRVDQLMPSLNGKEIVLGVSGGVACYKAADLASKLVQGGAGVSVVMTRSAGKFIGKTTFEALTNRPVLSRMFSPHQHYLGEHIGMARQADLLVIAPATANLIGHMANGIADDLLTTLVIASTSPVLIAPAMNNEMWNHLAVQRNITQLESDGVHIIGPESGWLSCGVIGPGRMAAPEQIVTRIKEILSTSL